MQKTACADRYSRKERRSAKNRRINTLMIVLSICAGVFALSLILFNTVGASLRAPENAKALKVGSETYTAAEFNFYYFGAYQSLLAKSNGSESLMGLDQSKSLAEQTCTVSDTKMSWQDYFTEQATDALSRMSVAYSEAIKAGYTKTATISDTVETYMDYYRVQSQSEGYVSLQMYLIATYGKGMTEDTLRGLMEKTCIGKAYTDDLKSKYNFTQAELKAYYSKHIAENATYSYLYGYVDGGSQETCSRLASAATQTEFESLTLKLTGSNCYTMKDVSGSELGTTDAKDVAWLSDSKRKAGDTYVSRNGNTGYVLYFLSANDNGYSSGKSSGWISIAKTGLSNEVFADWEKKAAAKYTVTVCSGMKYARNLN